MHTALIMGSRSQALQADPDVLCRYRSPVKNLLATVQLRAGEGCINMLRGGMNQASSSSNRFSTDTAESNLLIPSTTTLHKVNAQRSSHLPQLAGAPDALVLDFIAQASASNPRPGHVRPVAVKFDETDISPGLVDSLRSGRPHLLPSTDLCWGGDHNFGGILGGPHNHQADFELCRSLRDPMHAALHTRSFSRDVVLAAVQPAADFLEEQGVVLEAKLAKQRAEQNAGAPQSDPASAPTDPEAPPIDPQPPPPTEPSSSLPMLKQNARASMDRAAIVLVGAVERIAIVGRAIAAFASGSALSAKDLQQHHAAVQAQEQQLQPEPEEQQLQSDAEPGLEQHPLEFTPAPSSQQPSVHSRRADAAAADLLELVLSELHATFQLIRVPASQLMVVMAETIDHLICLPVAFLWLGRKLRGSEPADICR